jgi:hypothetical protein
VFPGELSTDGGSGAQSTVTETVAREPPLSVYVNVSDVPPGLLQ